MKYIICDIDGTLADSSHRNHKLPAYTGKQVSAAIDRADIIAGTKGTVFGRREIPGASQSIVTVRWATAPLHHIDKAYCWEDFMKVTGQSFVPWHEGMADDTPIAFTCWLVKAIRPMLLAQNMGIFFLTSRWESFRADTQAWLQSDSITLPGFNDVLHMRPVDDDRKDEAMKGQILDEAEAAGHEFFFALEDRQAVATYLRGRGIPVFHMADTP